MLRHSAPPLRNSTICLRHAGCHCRRSPKARIFGRIEPECRSVDDLSGGKRIECKDIVEMIAVEEQIKEAATTFKAVLDTAAHFGGEEVVQL